MVNDITDLYNTNPNYDLSKQTTELLTRYGWEFRFHEDNTLLPQEEMDKVLSKIQSSWRNDFKWQGAIPFISYANLLGLKDDIIKNDDDSVIGIIAPPGRGKSTFTLGCARFLDPTYTNDRTIFNKEQLKAFLKKVSIVYNQIKEYNKKGDSYVNPYHGSVVILDEGLYLLFSGDAASKDGKLLIKLFSVIRALGILFLINITNWQKISKGVKEDRFKALFRIPVKGVIQFFSGKKIKGIKLEGGHLIWPKPNFYEKTGKIDKDCQFWKEYDNKKSEFLLRVTHE